MLGPTSPPPTPTVVVKQVSLGAELVNAATGAVVAGLGAFTGAVTVTTATDVHALASAGIAAGFTALTFLSNSLRAWYAQRSGGV